MGTGSDLIDTERLDVIWQRIKAKRLKSDKRNPCSMSSNSCMSTCSQQRLCRDFLITVALPSSPFGSTPRQLGAEQDRLLMEIYSKLWGLITAATNGERKTNQHIIYRVIWMNIPLTPALHYCLSFCTMKWQNTVQKYAQEKGRIIINKYLQIRNIFAIA